MKWRFGAMQPLLECTATAHERHFRYNGRMNERRRRPIPVSLFVLWLAAAMWSLYSLWATEPKLLTAWGVGMAGVAASLVFTFVVIWAAGGFRQSPPSKP